MSSYSVEIVALNISSGNISFIQSRVFFWKQTADSTGVCTHCVIHWIASLHAWHFTCPVSLSLLHHINYINQATWRWGRITGTGGLASKCKFVSPSNEKISPASWFGLFIELGKNTFYCLNVHTFSTNVFRSLSFNWRLLTQYPYVKWKVIKWFFCVRKWQKPLN